jgi:hypothetical protein
MKVPQKYNKIFSDIMDMARKNDVKVTISEDDELPYPIGGFEVHGFFVTNGKYPKGELGIATGDNSSEWIKVLIHESCHMEQMIEQDLNWTNNFIYDGKYNKIKESLDLLEEWISGRNFSKSIIKELASSALNVELDCERRSAEKIKKYGLDINVEEYIQQSNSYIYFYRFIEESRMWYEKTPYQTKEVWSKMPKSFNNDYSVISDEMKKLFYTLLK